MICIQNPWMTNFPTYSHIKITLWLPNWHIPISLICLYHHSFSITSTKSHTINFKSLILGSIGLIYNAIRCVWSDIIGVGVCFGLQIILIILLFIFLLLILSLVCLDTRCKPYCQKLNYPDDSCYDFVHWVSWLGIDSIILITTIEFMRILLDIFLKIGTFGYPNKLMQPTYTVGYADSVLKMFVNNCYKKNPANCAFKLGLQLPFLLTAKWG